MRAALTEPIFGSTKRRSRTRAVLIHGGGSARICTSSIFPDASFFFSSALAVRTSFACSSACSRCSRDLPGTPAPALLSDTLRFSSQNRPLVKRATSAVTVAGLALGGLIYGPFTPLTYALFQAKPPPAQMSVVLAARNAIMMLATPLGTAVGGPLSAAIGPSRTLAASGGATVVLALITATGRQV